MTFWYNINQQKLHLKAGRIVEALGLGLHSRFSRGQGKLAHEIGATRIREVAASPKSALSGFPYH